MAEGKRKFKTIKRSGNYCSSLSRTLDFSTRGLARRINCKRFFIWLILALVVLALPATTHASVVLEYVDARQAYFDTFYNKTVAQLISEEAIAHNINPRLILVMLQRESSAVTQSTPSSTTRQAWPLFYNYDERMANCLNGDEASCNDTKYNHPTYRERAYDYGGVGQQIAYATAQLRNLQTNAGYCGGSLVVSVDGNNLTTDNAATCALYKYTPHIVSYNTGSAFYTNWVSWWGGTPNGDAYSATNTVSDANFNYVAMSASDINNFLAGKGSWLANHTIAEYISVPYPVVYTAPPPAPPRKSGDANGDGAVNISDLSILGDTWGQNVTANTSADFNGDGVVNIGDLSILGDNWGT